MEERARTYQNRISFLYNYVTEAHPEPFAAPCGPTEDLGWNHPSWETRSLGERAQRARWLKTDFDLSFPFIVDTMSNRMLLTYGGSLFYSGWVIDCDETVIQQQTWGWATPATQWCGLPLADVDELDQLLDSYLDSPPQCFSPPFEALETLVLPSVSKVQGFAQTDWRTEVALTNTSSEARSVQLQLRGSGDESEIIDISLNPGESRLFQDLVGEQFHSEGSSALWISSLPGIQASAHLSNQTERGRYGQFIRALSLNYAIASPMTGHLYPLEENDRFRTNVGLVNTRGSDAHFNFKAFNAEGELLDDRNIDLGPWEYVLKTRYLAAIAGAGIEGARIEIRATDDESAAFVFASMIDNISGDPTYLDAVPHLYSFDVQVPGVAHTEGSDNTHWRSRVAVVNINPHPVEIEAVFQAAGSPETAGPIPFTLEPHRLRLLDDPLEELFNTSGSGTLKLSALHGLAASGRTFNDTGELGSYGQRSPGLDPSGENTLRPGLLGFLIQLDENESRRSNLGLMNLKSTNVEIEAVLIAASGTELGRQTYTVPGGRSRQINRVFKSFTDQSVSTGRITLRVLTPDGRATAWASTIDSGTGDPVFQSLRVIDPR